MPATHNEYSVLGYTDDGSPAGIPYSIRQNVGIFGEIGSGKSSILRLLMLQDMQAGRGFMLIENHNELSREVLSMIPPSEYHRVVYVSLRSLKTFGKTLRFNPLECDEPTNAGMVAVNFTECLARAFSDSWGARVDTCARNGALAVIGTSGNTIGIMLRLLTDKDYRDSFASRIKNRQARDFFLKVYDDQYPKEAGGVIFNKLNKMMTIPEMDALFNTPHSSLDFKKIIDDGMYVILDFGGLPNDMVQFLGNVFMHLFYTNYRARTKNDGTGKGYKHFNLYLDEVQTFSPSMIRELLNTVRKYGIKATVATQSVSALDRDLADEIATLCRTVACFRCDIKTASHIKAMLPHTVERQQVLSWHRFALYSGGDSPIQGVLRTEHLPIRDRWEGAAATCLEKHGDYVSLEKYYTDSGGHADVLLSPLEFGILNMLRMNYHASRDYITEVMQRRFDVQARDVASALQDTLISSHNFVERRNYREEGDRNVRTEYVLTGVANKTVFSNAFAGRGAGGDLHVDAISAVMGIMASSGKYCVPDLGKGRGPKADMLIFSPQQVKDKESGQVASYHPFEWDEKNVIALEVEATPGKHDGQVYKNYTKNVEQGHRPWFLTFIQKDHDRVRNVLTGQNIPTSNYDLTLTSLERLATLAEAAKGGGGSGDSSSSSSSSKPFTHIEARIYDVIVRAGGEAEQNYICDNVYEYHHNNVIRAMEACQKKGFLTSHTETRANPGNPEDPNDHREVVMWGLKEWRAGGAYRVAKAEGTQQQGQEQKRNVVVERDKISRSEPAATKPTSSTSVASTPSQQQQQPPPSPPKPVDDSGHRSLPSTTTPIATPTTTAATAATTTPTPAKRKKTGNTSGIEWYGEDADSEEADGRGEVAPGMADGTVPTGMPPTYDGDGDDDGDGEDGSSSDSGSDSDNGSGSGCDSDKHGDNGNKGADDEVDRGEIGEACKKYAHMTNEMMLYIYEQRHDEGDGEAIAMAAVLRHRGYVIRARAGRLHLMKMPRKDQKGIGVSRV